MWSEQCPQRLLDDSGCAFKEHQPDRSKVKVTTSLMARAIARRIKSGFFPYFVVYELGIKFRHIELSKQEWPNAWKKTNPQGYSGGQRQNNSRSRTVHRCRPRHYPQAGERLLPFPQYQSRNAQEAVHILRA